MRLDKFVCKSTALSKAEATHHISLGNVTVNGVAVVNSATQVHENNHIDLLGTKLVARPFRYLMLHKPAGTICSNIDEVYPSVFTQLAIENASELHIAGRLDADTTGLVLATDDGRWSFNIIRPSQYCQKVYRVKLSHPIAEDTATRFQQGLQLQGESQLTQPAIVEVLGARVARLSITEGKFHQVKRMFAAVGNRVVALHREQIGPISLDIDEGSWRYLTEAEVAAFKAETPQTVSNKPPR
ncbi:Ribosomal small subunit pseudouridine synthase A [BD1-7 clade bacterium]|uniref:Ribosomal small subunit pseudouridine synthase A n=1 Tax=BD1-7 clade bacterium TaxID=2029982 RepID=A0A5S9PH25_9GAMM|nr:Ribosomal small subunit pseudouridine synthase A [BD1-7 clade bacterium]